MDRGGRRNSISDRLRNQVVMEAIVENGWVHGGLRGGKERERRRGGGMDRANERWKSTPTQTLISSPTMLIVYWREPLKIREGADSVRSSTNPYPEQPIRCACAQTRTPFGPP